MIEMISALRTRPMIRLIMLSAGVFFLLSFGATLLNSAFGRGLIRPVVLLTVTLSLLFGPAGVWGAAVGHLIAELAFGAFGPHTAFEYVGILLLGVATYKLWMNLSFLRGRGPAMDSISQALGYVLIVLAGAMAFGSVSAWGMEVLGVYQFSIVVVERTLSNLVLAWIFGPLILYFGHPIVEGRGMDYTIGSNMDPEATVSARGDPYVGILLVVPIAWAGWGLLISKLFRSLNAFESTILFANLYVDVGAIEWIVNAAGPGGRWLLIATGALLFAILWASAAQLGTGTVQPPLGAEAEVDRTL